MKPFSLADAPLQGMNLIEASAGTGKTFNIVHLFLRLLVEPRVDTKKPLALEQILVVTYTIAATQELRERIRKELFTFLHDFETKNNKSENPLIAPYLERFKEKELYEQCLYNLKEAVKKLEDLQVFTIHGFCQRMLQEHALASGYAFDAEVLTNDVLLSEVVDDFWRRKFYTAPLRLIRQMMDSKFGQGKNLTRGKMLSFCKKYLEYRNLKIVSLQEKAINAKEEQEYLSDLESLSHLWQKNRDEILNLLGSTGISRVKYRKTTIPVWGKQMDFLFQDLETPLPVPECFRKFTETLLSLSMNKGKTPPAHPFFKAADAFWEKYKETLASWDRWYTDLMKELLLYCKKELDRRKREANVVFFNDLLQQLFNALESSAGNLIKNAIQYRYQAALIDEFQDTDPLQWSIFKRLFNSPSHILFLIGDPKQAIYRFRGADLRTYLKASKDVQASESGGACYTLTQNYRSESELVKALNFLFSRSDSPLREAPFLEKEIVFEPMISKKQGESLLVKEEGVSKKTFHLWIASNKACNIPKEDKASVGMIRGAIVATVADEIYRLLTTNVVLQEELTQQEKPLLPSSFSVLVRTHYQGMLMQEALRARQIPAVIKSTGNVFRTEEAQDLHYVLQAILEPQQSKLVRTALITTIFGKTGEDLVELQTNESRIEQATLWMQEYHDVWKKHGIVSMARRMMAKSKAHINLLQLPQGKRRFTNFLHLIELLHNVSHKQKLNMEQTFAWFLKQRYENEGDSESYHLRPESDEEAVQIVTIHASKGLEYPIVFCPFAWEEVRKQPGESLFYNQDSEQCLSLDQSQIQCHEQAVLEILSEDLRLLYVALTRAVHRCYLVSRTYEEMENKSILCYLLGQKLEQLKNHEQITVQPLPNAISEDFYTGLKTKEAEKKLSARKFRNVIAHNWKMASFSYLIRNKPSLYQEVGKAPLPYEEALHHDEEANLALEEDEDPQGIFAFPRGDRAGNCIHEILCELDFTLPLSQEGPRTAKSLIQEKLIEYGYPEEHLSQYHQSLMEMLDNVLNTSLSKEEKDFTLSKIPFSDCLNELEFCFPLQLLTNERLVNLFKSILGKQEISSISLMEKLEFQPCHGFLRGYIDLVFCYQGKYYLVDWKSNHLGNQVECYHQENLRISMESNFYTLQYHLYLVALNQYLKQRLPNYDYKTHFGGVYYFYLRGMNRSFGTDFGVFYEAPSEKVVQALCEVLTFPHPQKEFYAQF